MNEVKPVISFTIPTWNRANELRECLDSIIPQILESNEKIEIVISDNASTDNTSEVVKEYLEKYDFLKYFKNSENLGFDLNLISAVEKASGDYVWLFSDDDQIAPGAIKEMLNIIHRWQPCTISLNYYLILNNEKIEYRTYTEHMVQRDIQQCDMNDLLLYRSHLFTFMTSNIVRKELIDISYCKRIVCEYENWIHLYMITKALGKKQCGFISSYYAVLARANNGRVDTNVFFTAMPAVLKSICEEYGITKYVKRRLMEDIRRDFLPLQQWIALIVLGRGTASVEVDIPFYYRLIQHIPRRILIFLWKCFRFIKSKGFSLPENIQKSLL